MICTPRKYLEMTKTLIVLRLNTVERFGQINEASSITSKRDEKRAFNLQPFKKGDRKKIQRRRMALCDWKSLFKVHTTMMLISVYWCFMLTVRLLPKDKDCGNPLVLVHRLDGVTWRTLVPRSHWVLLVQTGIETGTGAQNKREQT